MTADMPDTPELLPIWKDNGLGDRIYKAMHAYLDDYVFSPDEGWDHEPTEFERVLLEDFFNGAIGDEAVNAILQEAARAMQDAMAGRVVRVKALEEFARGLIRDAWAGCEGGDEIQEHAQKLGLIVEALGGYDPEKHGNSCEAEPGEPWFVFADWLDDALEPAWAQEGADSLGAVFADLAARQTPLGAEFTKVWDDNLDKLYDDEPAEAVHTEPTPAPDVKGAAFWERAYNRRTGQAIEARARATAAEAERDALKAEVERKDGALYQIANIGAGSTWYTAPSVVRKAEDIARAALAPAKGG